MLADTLNNINNLKLIASEEVAILFGIPTDRKRYLKETRGSGFLDGFLSWIPSKPKEFAQIQSITLDVEGYEQEIITPIRQVINTIHCSLAIKVYEDVKYRHFKKIVFSKKCKVIFLVAHHIVSSDLNCIEFADGGIDMNKVASVLTSIDKKHQPSIIFLVCESEGMERCKENNMNVGAIGSAFWKIPTVIGVEFISQWIKHFDGTNTITEAYNRAISDFITDGKY